MVSELESKYMNNNIIKFDKARFTVLTEHLIRIEYSETGEFEERMTQMVQNREFSEVNFDIIEKEETIEIITSTVHLYYNGGIDSSIPLLSTLPMLADLRM